MKIWRGRVVVLTFLLVCLSITGCGTSGNKAEDVLSQAQKASEKMNNFQANMKMNVRLGIKENPILDMNLDSDMKVKIDPQLAYTNTKVKLKGQTIPTEMYLDESNGYVKVAQSDKWYKIDSSNLQNANLAEQEQPDPAKELKLLKKYADDLSMDTSDEGYTFHVASKDGKMNDFFNEYMKEAMPGNQQLADALKTLSVDSFELTYVVDKKTYNPIKASIKLNATIPSGGRHTEMVEDVNLTYSNIGKLNDFSIPEEVKQKAVPMPDELKQSLSTLNIQ